MEFIDYGLVDRAILPKFEEKSLVLNRSRTRPVMAEYKKLADIVFQIDKRFHDDLFASENIQALSYKSVYDFYHDQYENNVMYIITKIKPKYWDVDKAAFSKKFAPKL